MESMSATQPDVPQQDNKSLSHFDHQDDVETQVTEDVFSVQREAWEMFEQFEKKMCSVDSTAAQHREKIIESFQQLHQHLLKEEEMQLAKIEEKKQKTMNDLQNKESLISDLCSSITKRLFLLENKEAGNLDTLVLNSFRTELEVLSKCDVSLHGHLPPIHKQVWRGIRHIVKPLLRSIQFDPQSAHTNLVFSKNLKQVRFSAFAQHLKSSNSFDPGLYVLGVPGFHSGQHYWEVDVGHKSNWVVGVVKESVPKKGPQSLEPAKGFWVLNKQGDNVYTGCGVSCPKSLPSPLRIGVFIDVLDGYLAFYDVDTTGLIFYITGCHFVGNLLPFFCPGVPVKKEDLGPMTLLN